MMSSYLIEIKERFCKSKKFFQSLEIILIFLAIFSLFNFQNSSIATIPPNIEFLQVPQDQIPAEIREFGLRIDKLNILAPVIANVDGTNKKVYNQALEKGVAHYKGTALPGEGGNIFIFGHSSSATGYGPYVNIFAPLEKLEKEDIIIVYFQNKTLEYKVFEKIIVAKTDVSLLKPTAQEQLTLMTCWPVGTSAKRLIIKAGLR